MQNNKRNEAHEIYKILRENASDVINKVEVLEKYLKDDGLVVMRYPSGTPASLLTKICKTVSTQDNLSGFDYTQINASHQSLFHLVRNGSPMHDLFEKRQHITGGINSPDIHDLGDFLIVHLQDGRTKEGMDFSLYKTSDDFHI